MTRLQLLVVLVGGAVVGTALVVALSLWILFA